MATTGHMPFWAKCGKCGHCWSLFNAPIDMALAGKLMRRATCTACGASGKSIQIAKQDAGVLLEGRPEPARGGSVGNRAAAWRGSGDTGESSKALWDVMMGRTPDVHSYPHDPDDLGRCLRLLALIPEWRPRIEIMRGVSKYWDALVDRWADLETSMLAELGPELRPGSAPKTYDMMQAALKPAEDADPGFIRLGAGMSMRFHGLSK